MPNRSGFLTAALLVGLSWLTSAVADSGSPVEVMAHHINMVKRDDVEEVMKDYAANAVVVLHGQTYIGTPDVRKFFENLAAEHRDWNSYAVVQEVREDGVVLQREVKTGQVEVYVVRGGKIVFQTRQ
jgi:hypothetical protein